MCYYCGLDASLHPDEWSDAAPVSTSAWPAAWVSAWETQVTASVVGASIDTLPGPVSVASVDSPVAPDISDGGYSGDDLAIRAASVLWPLQPGFTFNTSNAPRRVLTVRFETSMPSDQPAAYSGYTQQAGFTEAERNAFRDIFAEYESYLNIDFVETTSADADISLQNTNLEPSYGGRGRFVYSGSQYDGWALFRSYQTSNGSPLYDSNGNLLRRDLSSPNRRGLLVHELGHALTLKHTGNYDINPANAPPGPYLPANEDNGQYSVMSYNNDPLTGQQASRLMIYDVAGLQSRWGANLTYRTGNDTYTAPAAPRWVLWDAGGVDTISGQATGSRVTIYLTEGDFSSVGRTENLVIAYGAVIENAIGSRFADTLYGNAVSNVIEGGTGNDTIHGGAGIDRAVFNGASGAASWTRGATGAWTVVGADGTDTVATTELLDFADRQVALWRSSGQDLVGDFNGDGRDDVLWRNQSGAVATWEMRADGSAAYRSVGTSGFDWAVRGVGDFNGDGRDDILWRNETGATYVWAMNGSRIGTSSPGSTSNAWDIVATGDFNGNGTDDILWRNTSGQLYGWLMNNGTRQSAVSPGTVGTSWSVQGSGDFNGDGRDDILWRNADTGASAIWLFNAGAATVSRSSSFGARSDDWSVRGIGDFNGDGRDDILWRNASGQTQVWLMRGTTVVAQNTLGNASTAWEIQGVGDTNNDGRADIIWRNDTGQMSFWRTNAGATSITSFGSAMVAADWTVM